MMRIPLPAENDLENQSNLAWSEKLGSGVFAVVRRWNFPVPHQDQYLMVYLEDGKIVKRYGTHPSDIGARKYFEKRVKGPGLSGSDRT